MSAGVELSNVCADFGNFRAVDNLSVDVRPGEFFSFLGPSGCGKTTILRMISGFLPWSSGSIRIGGQDMAAIRPNMRPTALIFQNLALFPLMPVWENIAFGLKVRGVKKPERRARAEELLRIVDLSGAADKMVGQLSGGQKQRIAIARALAVEPQVMLLDEPLSALDLKLRQHMRSELRAIQAKTGVTFIYITHDQSEALAMSDRVAVMSKGKLQQVDTPQNIYNNPANGFVASFVGENAILDGIREGWDGSYATFRTKDAVFSAVDQAGAHASSHLRIFVRPENIRLATESEVNSIPVEIGNVVFEGNVINLVAKTLSGTTLVAQMSNSRANLRVAVGERVNFAFDPQNALLLPDDSSTGSLSNAVGE